MCLTCSRSIGVGVLAWELLPIVSYWLHLFEEYGMGVLE